jgi:hypothetical protein
MAAEWRSKKKVRKQIFFSKKSKNLKEAKFTNKHAQNEAHINPLETNIGSLYRSTEKRIYYLTIHKIPKMPSIGKEKSGLSML